MVIVYVGDAAAVIIGDSGAVAEHGAPLEVDEALALRLLEQAVIWQAGDDLAVARLAELALERTAPPADEAAPAKRARRVTESAALAAGAEE